MTIKSKLKEFLKEQHSYLKMISLYRKVNREIGKIQHLIDNILGYYVIPFLERRKVFKVNAPKVLQFPVNDICNSHCVMCNVWKNKLGEQIAAEEIDEILKDPLFEKIQYVSLNGGEPTLRKDLVEIAKACVERLPELKTIGLITNGILADQILKKCIAINDLCSAQGKNFLVSVSIDGVNHIHDKNRGAKGNFESAIVLLRQLKENGINHSIGFTITPNNVYWADDVLAFCEQNGINSYEFRPAVDIKRIYNKGYEAQHPYSDEEKFHLAMFFEKLSRDPKCQAMKRAYRNIADYYAYGNRRELPCLYWHNGVTLDSRATISYCYTESDCFGNALQESARNIFESNLDHRKMIIKNKCNDCYHHLDSTLTPGQEMTELFWRYKAILTNRDEKIKWVPNVSRNNVPDRHGAGIWKKVLITGWFGSETAGDKAILGETLHQIKLRSPKCKIAITSINPTVSRQTMRELTDLNEAEIIPLNTAANKNVIGEVDAVVIAGGPLMELPYLRYIYDIFVTANKLNKERVIFGYGVGPLYSSEAIHIAKTILKLATSGFFRDEESLQFYQLEDDVGKFTSAFDPAFNYTYRYIEQNKFLSKDKCIVLFTDQTSEYDRELNNQQNFPKFAAAFLDRIQNTRKYEIELYPMHNIWQGKDDRIFNRKIVQLMENPESVYLERAYLPLNKLIQSIGNARYGFVVRYHAHVFLTAMSIPYLSIDYSGKNQKISRLLKWLSYDQYSIPWRDFSSKRAFELFMKIENDQEKISKKFSENKHIIQEALEKAYRHCLD
ncbi:MAG: polysaccharide pyruvyl transferase family protein [Anaerolineaceae bacterium]|nr:polysaccharide pyruvyl transferase family protein [Anaerolineaceae bacterium]